MHKEDGTIDTIPIKEKKMYQLAILQTVAYRTVSTLVNDVLRPYHINTTQWIVLSIAQDYPTKYRVTDIAELLQVEGTLITASVRMLQKAELLTFVAHPTDKRARLLRTTDLGAQKCIVIEQEMRLRLQIVIQGMTSDDVQAYFVALHVFVANTASKNLLAKLKKILQLTTKDTL